MLAAVYRTQGNPDVVEVAEVDKPRPGLAEIRSYADGVGANTAVMVPLTATGTLGSPTSFVADAHNAGLIVHGWTFRAENTFLPNEFDVGEDPAALGRLDGQVRAFLKLGMDGFFTDHPHLGKQARDAFVAE